MEPKHLPNELLRHQMPMGLQPTFYGVKIPNESISSKTTTLQTGNNSEKIPRALVASYHNY